ncbi:hypothetical protein ACJIZ3_023797 [Penstemon smallii]|uniref:Reverse transcriptase domain-containing protein n=1 Tax=Penstemon smallii TaxID=265156 RepID=A0ABD3TRI4_9LAMI
MNCLAWNCQGLGGLLTIQNLGFHIRDHNPQIIFLSETKSRKRKIELLKAKFGFFGVYTEARGKSGGLALLWRKEVRVELQSFSENHIDAYVFMENDHVGWRLTGFYGEPDATKRKKSWNLLRRLASSCSKPWLCIGDFNALLYNSEKKGRNIIPAYQLREFRTALQDSGLSDIGFSGYPFTWSNGWEFPGTVEERLDRACVSHTWIQKFPHSRVEHLKFGGSDHAPILLRILDHEVEHRKAKKRMFMFESMWLDDANCSSVVRESWGVASNTTNVGDTLGKLNSCREHLKSWSESSFGRVNKRVAILREKIDKLRKGIITIENKRKINCLTMELEELLDKEEKMWQQRAKAHLMREGDRNTRYFHSRASGRQKKNEIRGIRKEDGSWCKTEPEIEKVIVDYFSDIFTSSQPSEFELDLVLRALRSRVSFEDNQYLLQPYTADEVTQALFSMYPLKSPGPDGFPPLFFQKYWCLIRNDVTKWVLDFLNDGLLAESCNFTNIALIPKCQNPELMTQFRPISLCNVMYKIASKTVANRLKPLMNSVISESQSAFVPGRQITDNVLVAYETTHFMKKQTRGDVGQMAIKLDLSKAYDRVEWDFLRAVMIRLGFDVRFVNLIMTCVSTVTYSFILNGTQIGFVKPERGIRQGDPLSPYLFLFCAESLSSLISQEENRGNLQGISVCEHAPCVSHLLFADDTLIFCQATTDAAIRIHNLLHAYGLASGQHINLKKSSVVFTRNTPETIISLILSYFPIQREQTHSRYLGLPLVAGKSKREVFDYIRERVWERLQSLRIKSLSKAGKEVLIKSVIQAIPSYLMSCFKLPNYLISEINSMVSSFWWDDKDAKKIHWLKWDSLCSSKRDGGMGFRDLSSFNMALLAKQAWRILVSPNSLLSRIFRARYFPHSHLLDAPLGSNPSLTWRGIRESLRFISAGLRWRIGNGNSVRIWGDKWLPRPHSFRVTTPPSIIPEDSTISVLFDADCGSWNRQLVESIFSEEEAQLILSIPLGSTVGEDRILWHFERSGLFSVKSAYRLIRDISRMDLEARTGGPSTRMARDWNWIWKLAAPPKVRLFLWNCCSGTLPVCEKLKQRRVPIEAFCPRCDHEIESILHCLLRCSYARQIWALSGVPYHTYNSDTNDTEAWLCSIRSKTDAKQFGWIAIMLWWIWYARNKILWENDDIETLDLISFARDFYNRFQNAMVLHRSPSTDRTSSKWQPPPGLFIKINVDAAFNKVGDVVGFGMIARNREGVCVGWKTDFVRLPLDPEAAEATAAFRAIEFGVASGWSLVILEGDCSTVIKGISDPSLSFGPLGHIYDDINRLSSNLESFRASHVVRDFNMAAHVLAKLAASHFTFPSCLPASVENIVISEYPL